MSAQFISIVPAEGNLPGQVRVDSIQGIFDNGKKGSRLSMGHGWVISTPERYHHLLDRIERLS